MFYLLTSGIIVNFIPRLRKISDFKTNFEQLTQSIPKMHSVSLISTLAIGFGVALVLGFLAEKIKVPALVGYLIAGILVSPSVFGFDVDLALANQLAEIGVMLLMFGVGLHFSLSDLIKVKGLVVPGAICQMISSTLVGTALSYFWGWDFGHALLMGLCLSCASTVVVLKALEARGLLQGFDGNVAVGWLVVQDMVTVLLLVLLPPLSSMLGGQAQNTAVPLWQLLLITFAQVIVFIVLMLVIGKRVLPFLLWQVAKTGSRELFTLCVLAVAIGIAFGASEIFHVLFALGAFFAGMVMRESQYAHRAAIESLPLRDAFSVIFFVGVGMMFDPSVIMEHPFHLLGILLIILLFNPVIATILVVLLRYPLRTALTLGACLGQIGEFSFILAGLGQSLGLVTEEGMNLVLAAAIFSIAVNPFAFASMQKVGDFLKRKSKLFRVAAARPSPQSLMPDDVEQKKITGHVVVVGYGEVGRKLCNELNKLNIPVVILDKDDALVQKLRRSSLTAIQGDAVDPSSLLQAHVHKSPLLILTIRDEILERKVVETSKLLNPDIKFILRATTDSEAANMTADNLGMVVQASNALADKMCDLVRKELLEGDNPQDKEIVENSKIPLVQPTNPS